MNWINQGRPVWIAVLLLFTLASCQKKLKGEGPVVTEVRNISGFNGIDMRVTGQLYFKQDSVFRVEIKAQQNILEAMETYVSNNSLVIKFEKNKQVVTHEIIHVIVSLPVLERLQLNGAGSMHATSSIQSNSLKTDINGSGSINLTQLDAGSVEARINGSGKIKALQGIAPTAAFSINGSGDIDMSQLETEQTSATITGSGNIWVKVSQQLQVNISGSGTIYYQGHPQIYSSISGSGSVKPF